MLRIPADPNGYSKSERFQGASQTMDYLTNDKKMQYLAKLEFEKGHPIFNDHEIFMVDNIKKSIQILLTIWQLSLAATFILGLFAWAGNLLPQFRYGVKRGGWLTIGLTIIIGVAVILFNGFNPSLYIQNTDTFMRLFPISLWRDFFLFMAISMIGSGFLLAISLAKIKNISQD